MTKHPRVLIIEDDDWFADEYVRTLGPAGYVVERASNVLDAIELIDTTRPQVIMLDLFMPGPNGLVLLHEIQSHSDLSNIPIIVVTNAAADLKPDILQPYGVQVVLDKTTIHPGDILAAVRRVLL